MSTAQVHSIDQLADALPDDGSWPSWLSGCDVCPDPATHLARAWFPCEHPERPLDLHGLFGPDRCCQRAYEAYGCPRQDLPELTPADRSLGPTLRARDSGSPKAGP